MGIIQQHLLRAGAIRKDAPYPPYKKILKAATNDVKSWAVQT